MNKDEVTGHHNATFGPGSMEDQLLRIGRLDIARMSTIAYISVTIIRPLALSGPILRNNRIFFICSGDLGGYLPGLKVKEPELVGQSLVDLPVTLSSYYFVYPGGDTSGSIPEDKVHLTNTVMKAQDMAAELLGHLLEMRVHSMDSRMLVQDWV